MVKDSWFSSLMVILGLRQKFDGQKWTFSKKLHPENHLY